MDKVSGTKWIVLDRFNSYVANYIAAVDTKEEAMDIAERILSDYVEESNDDAIPDDILNGSIMVAKVVAQSGFKVTARRSDYDLEEWPYPASMDIVGDLYMREIGDDE
jgi:hypothetical protein